MSGRLGGQALEEVRAERMVVVVAEGRCEDGRAAGPRRMAAAGRGVDMSGPLIAIGSSGSHPGSRLRGRRVTRRRQLETDSECALILGRLGDKRRDDPAGLVDRIDVPEG